MATNEEILELMQVIVSAYPSYKTKGFVPGTYAIYARLLQDIDIDVLRAAAMDQIANNEWPPTVAELRKAAFDNISAKTNRLTAQEAWALVIKAVRSSRMGDNGCYVYPLANDLPDLVMQCVQYLGGMRAIGSNEDPPGVLRAQFERAFNAILARAEENTRMLPEVKALSERLALEAQCMGDGTNAAGMESIAGILSDMTGGAK